MNRHEERLERIQFIPRPRREVFDFFSRASNLERLTPAFLGFQILTPEPIEMAQGTLIDYRIALFGIPMRWRTRIESFEPEHVFTDVQLRGPYRRWHHTHEFFEVPGGTVMRDVVIYEVPFGWLGRIARMLFVRLALRRIFDFRRQAVAAVFGPANLEARASSPGAEPIRVPSGEPPALTSA